MTSNITPFGKRRRRGTKSWKPGPMNTHLLIYIFSQLISVQVILLLVYGPCLGDCHFKIQAIFRCIHAALQEGLSVGPECVCFKSAIFKNLCFRFNLGINIGTHLDRKFVRYAFLVASTQLYTRVLVRRSVTLSASDVQECSK